MFAVHLHQMFLFLSHGCNSWPTPVITQFNSHITWPVVRFTELECSTQSLCLIIPTVPPLTHMAKDIQKYLFSKFII